ncbi:hypothetical protein ISCGN_030825 [Ixodes scapularis]
MKRQRSPQPLRSPLNLALGLLIPAFAYGFLFHKLAPRIPVTYFCLNSNNVNFTSRCCTCQTAAYQATLQICLGVSQLPPTVNTTQAMCIARGCCQGVALYIQGKK